MLQRSFGSCEPCSKPFRGYPNRVCICHFQRLELRKRPKVSLVLRCNVATIICGLGWSISGLQVDLHKPRVFSQGSLTVAGLIPLRTRILCPMSYFVNRLTDSINLSIMYAFDNYG